MEELFSEKNNERVKGMRLADLLDWYEEGVRSAAVCVKFGALKLPPVQRTAVWKPKQILDLWDSVLRGLPIGSFLLVKRPPDGLARDAAANATNAPAGEGWDLLDGQQRLRALLLGTAMGSDGRLGDRQCLWIDLLGAPKTHRFALHLTSESQPFGYASETGEKLGIDDRRKARLEIEPEPKTHFITKGERAAYTHEIFAGFVNNEMAPLQGVKGRKDGWPPVPYKANRAQAAFFPLHSLMEAWRAATGKDRFERLHQITGGGHPDAVRLLDEAFGFIESAQVALLKVEVSKDELPILFDRIGASGTPLSTEERLFSIYKHHESRVHDAIVSIYYGGAAGRLARVGRVLPPVKIAASAIRIANALAGNSNALPDVAAFSREMLAESALKKELSAILPVGDRAASDGPFARAFGALFQALAYTGGKDSGIPKVMSTRLSPDLVQLLLMWIIANSLQIEAVFEARGEMIRFVLFWIVCVTNETKASSLCFEIIREKAKLGKAGAPFHALYDELVKKQVALAMRPPDKVATVLVAGNGSPVWRAVAERFPTGETLPDLARAWWLSKLRVLEWLQRAELEELFADFDPTSGRDEETPYDVDHILPQAGWGDDWRHIYTALKNSLALTASDLNAMRYSRYDLGNSIGNKWLVSFSDNRAWKNSHWNGDDGKANALKQRNCFDSSQQAAWTVAWGAAEKAIREGPWSRERLIAFQDVIERRAVWLYRRYYDEAGFAKWEPSRRKLSNA